MIWGVLAARARLPAWAAVLAVAGVAVARLFLGARYLAAVLGGAAFGIALLATSGGSAGDGVLVDGAHHG